MLFLKLAALTLSYLHEENSYFSIFFYGALFLFSGLFWGKFLKSVSECLRANTTQPVGKMLCSFPVITTPHLVLIWHMASLIYNSSIFRIPARDQNNLLIATGAYAFCLYGSTYYRVCTQQVVETVALVRHNGVTALFANTAPAPAPAPADYDTDGETRMLGNNPR